MLLVNPTVQRRRGFFVNQIHRRVDFICLELLGQTSVYLHALDMLQNSPVYELCHSVLMRILGKRLHSSNFLNCAELFESVITVFAIVVGLQALKLPT